MDVDVDRVQAAGGSMIMLLETEAKRRNEPCKNTVDSI